MKLFYREKGEKNGIPLIILHGLWGASDNWLPMAGLLTDRFRIILPDLRNHGQSPQDAEMNYEVMSDDVAELIASLDLPIKPIIAGHSMGGKVVMNLLLKKPEIVAKGIVIDVAPINYANDNHMDHIGLLNFVRFTNLGGFREWQEVSDLIVRQFPDERLRQLLLKNIRKHRDGFSWRINAEAINNHLADLLGWNRPGQVVNGHKEVLFIKGANSDDIQRPHWAVIKEMFPAATHITIPHAGHWIHAEQPHALAQCFRFLQNPPTSIRTAW